jgi:hypothetical protein
MRWIVEVSSIGKIDKQAYCVDSESWQRALQAARGLRDDHAPMTGFSIELLDEGFSAVDPMTRLRYFIKRAPDDAPLTPQKPAPEPVAPEAAPTAVAPRAAPTASQPSSQGMIKAAPRPTASSPPKKQNLSKTFVFGSTGAALMSDDKKPAVETPQAAVKSVAPMRSEPPRPTPSVKPAAPAAVTPSVIPVIAAQATAPLAAHDVEPRQAVVSPRPVVGSSPPESPSQGSVVNPIVPPATLPGIEVLFKREQDPDARSPLSYREYMYFFAAASDEAMAKAMLVAQFDLVRTSLEHARPGKLINLAMFDLAFTGKPPVMPVVTLTWKDWKGEPVIDFPRRGGSPSVPPDQTPPPSTEVVPAPVSTVDPEPVGFPPPRSVPVIAVTPSVEEPPAPPAASPAPAPMVGGARRPGSKPNIRLRGDELIADLFEAMHYLHFLRDSVEGADFCLTLALEKIPSRVGIVHLYDIDRREFVVTCVRGPNPETALLKRYPESDPILTAAMRKQHAIVFSDTGDANNLERYRIFGGAKSLVVAPVLLAGRFLGALELMDPLDGFPFSENEGYALTYIAEQFAEFVATRGVNVDPERIAASARAP